MTFKVELEKATGFVSIEGLPFDSLTNKVWLTRENRLALIEQLRSIDTSMSKIAYKRAQIGYLTTLLNELDNDDWISRQGLNSRIGQLEEEIANESGAKD